MRDERRAGEAVFRGRNGSVFGALRLTRLGIVSYPTISLC